MRERIEQLAKGMVRADMPQLVFFPDILSREVPAGAVINLEILVKSKNKVPFKGFFYSSDERVRVCTPAASGLTGTANLEISTKNSEPGEEICGELQMVSNAGEKRLEYRFAVASSDGGEALPITLEAFAKLAMENGRRAQRLFASPRFLSLPFMAEPAYAAYYEGIRGSGREDQALESFLVACGMKEPVTFELDKAKEIFQDAEGARGRIGVRTNIWGSIKIRISADMAWLRLEKSLLTEQDLKDGGAFVTYQIDEKALHAGNNTGEIRFQSDKQSLSVFVEVHKARRSAPAKKGKPTKEMTAGLYQMLLAYLNSSYEDSSILTSLDRNLNGCIKKCPGELDLYLFRAWLLVEKGHMKEAGALLEWCRDTIAKVRGDMPVEYCIFLYLDSTVRGDSRVTENAYKIIHKYFESVPSLIIALLELCVIRSDATEEEAIAYLEDLQKAYGSSPLVYALAARIYRRKPQLMRADSPFMLYVFNYMVKYQCTNEAATDWFLNQLAGVPKNSGLFLHLLERMYRESRNIQVLTAICSLLVRQQKTGGRYSLWYEEGIRREIQLTSLNDYYLASLSIDQNSRLPINILLYYSYKSDLDDKTRLGLYSYVLNHYEKDSDMYRAYEDQMNQFAVAQLLAGKINPKLVLLYRTILSPDLVDKRLARVLPALLFSRQITTGLSFAQKVVVRYPQLNQEFTAPLADQKASIPVYTENAVLLFEDKYGNRYSDPACKAEPLMYDSNLIAACRRQAPNQLMLMLEETCLLYQKPIQDEQMYGQVCRLLDNAQLSESYRRLLMQRRIDYCYYSSIKEKQAQTKGRPVPTGSEDGDTLWLLGLNLAQFDTQERCRVIELYIMRGYEKEAFAAVCTYGCGRCSSGIKLPLLLQMTVRHITESLYEYDENVLWLGQYLLLKQQWNDTLLTYMTQHYNGTTDSMMRLLILARDKKADLADLAERVVAQMMFTGSWGRLDEAYDCYCQTGHVSESVKRAYFVIKCHEYLMGMETISVENIRTVEALMFSQESGELPAGFPLALLQYYGTLPSLDDKQKKLCESLVYGLCAKEIYLGCYPALEKHIEMSHQMEGRVIVQRQGEPDEQVWMEGIRKPQSEAVRMELTQVYPGIYTGAFFLFPDESVELILYHASGMEQEECDRLTIHAGGCYVREDSLYEGICRSITLFEDGNYEELKRHRAQTERQKRVMADLFTLM